MVLTSTISKELGFKAPDFKLLEPLTNKYVKLDDIKSKHVTLIVFMCNHCPYVIHILPQLVKIANDYKKNGISIVGINSNDISEYPDDSPEKMCHLIKKYKIPFPYLFDETQEIAKSYYAACTPDFSLFNSDMICLYRGQIDSSRPGNDLTNDGKDIRMAIDAIISGKNIQLPQHPSVGCNIKWKNK